MDQDDLLRIDIARAILRGPKWWVDRRDLPDGRELVVVPLSYTRARLVIQLKDAQWYLDGW